MKDSSRRAIRTLYQGIVGAVIVIPGAVALIQQNIPAESAERPRIWGYVSAGCAALLVVTALVTKAVNALEAAGKMPAWLKQPPATPASPDPSDTGPWPADVAPPPYPDRQGPDPP